MPREPNSGEHNDTYARSGADDFLYARDCEAWMFEISALAAKSHTGSLFKVNVEAGHATLARDAQNQVVALSPTGLYSTVVDRSLYGTTDPFAFHRWVSSIDRSKLPSKFDVREGEDYAADPKLELLLKNLDSRQALDARRMTEQHDKELDSAPKRYPEMFEMHIGQRRQQSADFESERSRYIEEYQEARRMAEEREREEKQKSLSQEFGERAQRGRAL